MTNVVMQGVQQYGAVIVVLLAFVFAMNLYHRYISIRQKIETFNAGIRKDEFGNDWLGHKFREICLNFEDFLQKRSKKLVLKTEPNSYLINCVREEFEKSYWFKSSGVFTGVALILTFLLIGHSVHDIGISLPSIDKNNLSLLGNPIAELQQKFYVSIAGIVCTIFYQMFCAVLMKKLSSYSHQELHLREKIEYVVRESQDLLFQEIQARGAEGTLNSANMIFAALSESRERSKSDLEEIKDLLKSLKNIDVTVGSFAESVTTKLESSIDRSVGDKLTDLIRAQNASTERIASQIGEVLSKSIGQELEKAFNDLASKLPNIMSNGAGEATSRMAEAVLQASSAFQSVSSSMPALVTQMTSMLKQIQIQQGANNELSERVNSDLIKNLNEATTLMSSQNAQAIQQQAEIVNALRETIRDVSTNVKSTSLEMQDSMRDGAGKFSEKVNSASEGIKESLSGMIVVLNEVEKVIANLRDSNKQLLGEFSHSISEFKMVASSVATSNSSLANTITSLSELSKELNNAPLLTQALVESTSSALNAQQRNIEKMLLELSQKTEIMSRTLADQYSRGVEMVAKTFVEKIGEIEGQTKNIRGVYSAAGQALTTSMEPLEALSENIQELNRSIKSLPNLRNS